MTIKWPGLSPYQAMERLKVDDLDFYDGFHYWMDGPMMSPEEAWSPFAMEGEDEVYTFYCDGIPGEEVTEATKWRRINNETGEVDLP